MVVRSTCYTSIHELVPEKPIPWLRQRRSVFAYNAHALADRSWTERRARRADLSLKDRNTTRRRVNDLLQMCSAAVETRAIYRPADCCRSLSGIKRSQQYTFPRCATLWSSTWHRNLIARNVDIVEGGGGGQLALASSTYQFKLPEQDSSLCFEQVQQPFGIVKFIRLGSIWTV